MADALKKFGKYFLLDLLAQGGMAEVYRARMAILDGGARLVVIKRIITSYSQNQEFVTMFKSEIRTTSGFTHPNIIQIYDYGIEQDQPYITMEFVDGKNLRQLIAKGNELKIPTPPEICAYIMEHAAAALAYAHVYKDKFTGKGLNIVHRDISPQNILVSYDGSVKVIDFGIAKAITNVEATRAGVIKGKPSYLSPEQVAGEPLDGRSDIFALGAVFWETLTGRKLFASDNDYGVLRLIEDCTNHVKPPSLYNPKVSRELDDIVMKSLQKDRNSRYQTAEAMQRAIHKFLQKNAPDVNESTLAQYAQNLFKEEILSDWKKLQALNEKAENLVTELEKELKEQKISGATMPSPQSAAQKQPPRAHSTSIRMVDFGGKEKSEVKLEFETGKKAPESHLKPAEVYSKYQEKASAQPTISKPKSSRRFSFAQMLILAAIAAGGYYYFTYQPSPSSSNHDYTNANEASLILRGNVKNATVTINGKEVADSLPATIKPLPSDKDLKLVISSNGYENYSQEINLKPSEIRAMAVTLTPEREIASKSSPTTQSNSGTFPLRINITPQTSGVVQIKLDETTIDPWTRIGKAPLDTPVTLVVEKEGFRTFRKTFTIDSSKVSGLTEWVVEVPLVAAKFGFLSIKTTPSADAYFDIDGDGIEEKVPTPISRKRIPVGTYKIRLVNSLLGMEKNITVTINEDRFTNVEEKLEVSGDQKPVENNLDRLPSSH